MEYARLVRKGVSLSRQSHALEAGPAVHSVTAGAQTACFGASVGHVVELTQLSVISRLGLCRSRLDNTFLRGSYTEYDASMAIVHPRDTRYITFAAGVGVAATIVHQSYETAGLAPARTSIAPGVQLVVAATRELTGRTFLRFDARVGTDFVRLQARADDDAQLVTQFVARLNLSLGLFLR